MVCFKSDPVLALIALGPATVLSLILLNSSKLQAEESPPDITFDSPSGVGGGSAASAASMPKTAAGGSRQVQLHLDGGFAENAEKRVSPVVGIAMGVTLSENLAIDFDMRYRSHFGDSNLNGSYSSVSLSPMLRTSYELWDGFFLRNLFGIGLGILSKSENADSDSGNDTRFSPVWTLGVGIEQRMTDAVGLNLDLRLNHLDYRRDYFFALPDTLDVTVGATFRF